MSDGFIYSANAYLKGVEFHKTITRLTERTNLYLARRKDISNLRTLKMAIESYGLSSSLVGFVGSDGNINRLLNSFPATEDLDNIPLPADHPVVEEVTAEIEAVSDKEEEIVVQYLEESADDLTTIFTHLSEQLPNFRDCLNNLTDELSNAVATDATVTIVPFGREQERLDTLSEIIAAFEIPEINEDSDAQAIAETIAQIVEKLNSVIKVELVDGQLKVDPTVELFELEEVTVADALEGVTGLTASIDNLISVLQIQAEKRGAEHVDQVEDIADDFIDDEEVVDPTVDNEDDTVVDDTTVIADTEASEDLDDIVDLTNTEDDAIDDTPAEILEDLNDSETTEDTVIEEVVDVVEETGTVAYTAAVFVQILVALIETSLKTLNSSLGALDALANVTAIEEAPIEDLIDEIDDAETDEIVDDILADDDTVDEIVEELPDDFTEGVVDPTED